MKTGYTVLIAILIGFSCLGLNAQERNFQAAFSLGLPVGDSRNVVQTSFIIEAAYVFTIADNITLGPKLGYNYMTGEEVLFSDFIDDAPDQNYILAAVTGEIMVLERLGLGADVGYGLEVNSKGNDAQFFGIPVENTSGFYYSPRVTYHFNDRVGLNMAYRSIVLESFSWDSISAGLIFNLF